MTLVYDFHDFNYLALHEKLCLMFSSTPGFLSFEPFQIVTGFHLDMRQGVCYKIESSKRKGGWTALNFPD
jgi:hypothetical protein